MTEPPPPAAARSNGYDDPWGLLTYDPAAVVIRARGDERILARLEEFARKLSRHVALAEPPPSGGGDHVVAGGRGWVSGGTREHPVVLYGVKEDGERTTNGSFDRQVKGEAGAGPGAQDAFKCDTDEEVEADQNSTSFLASAQDVFKCDTDEEIEADQKPISIVVSATNQIGRKSTDPKFRCNQLVIAEYGRERYKAKVLKARNRQGSASWDYRVHFVGWSDRWDEWLPESDLLDLADETAVVQAERAEFDDSGEDSQCSANDELGHSTGSPNSHGSSERKGHVDRPVVPIVSPLVNPMSSDRTKVVRKKRKQQAETGGKADAAKKPRKVCRVQDCEKLRQSNSAGMCRAHYVAMQLADENKEEECILTHAEKATSTLADSNSDICFICRHGGELLCCDFCERSHHLQCHSPPLASVPEGAWKCMECKKTAGQDAPRNDVVETRTEMVRKESALRRSMGRNRQWLNSEAIMSLLKRYCGIFTSFGMASIATKGGKVSHLVLNDEWNVLASDPHQEQEMYIGVGATKATTGPKLAAVDDKGLPLFHAPKISSKGDKRIYYVGNWAPIREETQYFNPPKYEMGKDRQMLIRLRFVRYDKDISCIMRHGKMELK